jgi:hypothetical protein
MAAPTENIAAEASSLEGTRCGNFRDSQFSARVSRQRVLRHRLLGHLPRQWLVDTSLGVDFGKFVEFECGVFAQLLAFTCKISLLSVRLRTDGNIFAGRHRHRPSHQSRNTCNQHIASRCSRGCNADDQARGRDDTVIRSQNGGPEPPDPIDEMDLGVNVKVPHILLLTTP